jgi:hypothetical protein
MMSFILTVFDVLYALPVICCVCSAIAATTPTPLDDKLWAKFYKLIDVFALNIGKAKEK